VSKTPTTTWRERLASPLTWHYTGFAVLLVLTIVLSVRLGLDWAATNGRSTDALAEKQIELKAMDLKTAPLRGLDQRVAASREQIQEFYEKRIPSEYSSFASRIGELQVKSGVRLSRVQYTQGKPDGDLIEISMDAGISGAYPDIMRFVNSLERNEMFFMIRGMQLTGQQGGLVNLRLRVSTWMRQADVPMGLPTTPKLGEDVPSASSEPAAPAAPIPAGKEGE
jgi:Tfp pilus assembly protein PilO